MHFVLVSNREKYALECYAHTGFHAKVYSRGNMSYHFVVSMVSSLGDCIYESNCIYIV